VPADADFKPGEVADACRLAAEKIELGDAMYASDEANDALSLQRKKAYALADAAVSQLRAGQFAFRTMPRKVIDYRDNYAAAKARRARKAAKEAAAAQAESGAVSPVPAASQA
jgi:hypothetical protein